MSHIQWFTVTSSLPQRIP